MKTIGIIGGLAWPSTITYYQNINRLISEKLGPLHCAKLIIVQINFDQITKWINSEQWEKVAEALLSLARQLERGGADFIVVACNTVHKVVPAIQDQIPLPILHIVDAASGKIRELGFSRVGLIGSALTMTDDYFAGRLAKYQIEALLPSEGDQKMIHHALETELAPGIFLPETRARFKEAIGRLIERGAEAIVLGCTEFGKLVQADDSSVPLIDTAKVHSEMAAKMALS
ncbi:aspartate racemase [Penicillium daleae]|jgi:aspartate racemase|uniref:Aspartate racemase n=1 Tax=Penicillium daleae TaxID=63821 RepID=A0AAD6C159_9EURO|nr:aspartate racemase [Penicillium daleae]KAJ5443494.1 aspartate racemase [Penicillium daleae]